MLNRYISFVDALNEHIGRLLAWCLPLMTVITLLVIFCNTALDVGWIWMSELVVYMYGMLFMLASGYTLMHDEHVRIDVFYNRLSARGKAWANLFGVFFLLLPVCLTILWFSYPYVASSWEIREHSYERQGLPIVYLLKTCILLLPVLMILQGLSLAAKSYLRLMNKPFSPR